MTSFILMDAARLTSPAWRPALGILARNVSIEVDDEYRASGRASIGRLVAPASVIVAFLGRIEESPLRLTVASAEPGGRVFECVATACRYSTEGIAMDLTMDLALAPAPPSLTFAAFSAANVARCESPEGFNHTLDSWSLSDWFLAVTGELGEAANVGKKLNRVRDGIPGNKLPEGELRAMFLKEIGDAIVYTDLLAQSQGFTLEDAVRAAFDAKSEEIGYPIKLDP